MQLEQFIKNMVPLMRRGDLLEDLDASVKIIREVSLPIYERGKFLDRHKWKDRRNQEFQKYWEQADRANKGNWVPATRAALENILKTSEVVSRMIQRSMADETYAQAMSYFKATLVQYSTYVSFFSRYANEQLNCAAALEALAINPRADVSEPKPADQRWLVENRKAFCMLNRIMSMNDRELKRELNKVPDTVIDVDQLGYQVELLGKTKTDPLRMGFIPVAYNPILWVRTKIADFTHDRYEAALEQRTTVEMRLANLQAMSNGSDPDPNIEKQIAYRQDQLTKLNRKISEYEEQVNGA